MNANKQYICISEADAHLCGVRHRSGRTPSIPSIPPSLTAVPVTLQKKSSIIKKALLSIKKALYVHTVATDRGRRYSRHCADTQPQETRRAKLTPPTASIVPLLVL
jgi:hypothetical protein